MCRTHCLLTRSFAWTQCPFGFCRETAPKNAATNGLFSGATRDASCAKQARGKSDKTGLSLGFGVELVKREGDSIFEDGPESRVAASVVLQTSSSVWRWSLAHTGRVRSLRAKFKPTCSVQCVAEVSTPDVCLGERTVSEMQIREALIEGRLVLLRRTQSKVRPMHNMETY